MSVSTLRFRVESLGFDLVNPPGQDGCNCQFIAVIDQLKQCEILPPGLTPRKLKELAFAWIQKNASLLIDSRWKDPDASGELAMLRSFIPNFATFITNEESEWGNHETLMAICVVLMERFQKLVDIKVCCREP